MEISSLIPKELLNRFFKGASWSLIGSIFSQGINFCIFIFIARILGKDAYGEFILIQSTIITFGVFAGVGLGSTSMRYIAALKDKDRTKLNDILNLCQILILTISIVLTTLLFFFSEHVIENIYGNQNLILPFSIASFAVIFSAIDGYQKSSLIGFEAMKFHAISLVAGVAISAPIMLFLASNYGILGVAWSLVLTSFFNSVISWFLLRLKLKEYKIDIKLTFNFAEIKVLGEFALPAFLGSILVSPVNWLCFGLLSQQDSGFSELAILGVAMQWYNLIIFLPTTASKVVVPMLSNLKSQDKDRDIKTTLLMTATANLIVSMPLAIIVIMFSDYILMLYGPEFITGAPTVKIAAITAVVFSLISSLSGFFPAILKMWTGTFMNLCWALVYITGTFLMINLGSLGVIMSFCIAYVLHAMWTIFYVVIKLKTT